MADVKLFSAYQARAEALLPVNIGAGQENTIDPLEYVVKDGWFYRIAASEYLLDEPGNLGMEAETHYYNGKNNTAADAVDAVFDDAEKHSRNERVTCLRVGRISHLECMTFSDRPQNSMDKSRHLCQMSERTHGKGWGHTRNLVNGGIPLGVIRCELVAC